MTRYAVLQSKNLTLPRKKAIDQFRDKISRWRRRYSTSRQRSASCLPPHPGRFVKNWASHRVPRRPAA